MARKPGRLALVPWAFVIIWSTGFIAAKFSVPYMEPFSLLLTRMLCALLVFTAILFWQKPSWCTPIQAAHQMVVGFLVHACFLGGVFVAISRSLPAGITSLITGLQPLLTAVFALIWLHESLDRNKWIGLFLGLAGVIIVVSQDPKEGSITNDLTAWVAAILAVIAISIGTLYQKRFGVGVNLIVGSFFQYLATAIVMGVLAWNFDTGTINWNWTLVASLTWMVLALSVVAVLLLLMMIREGESGKIASYFYLVPPLTALEAWVLFGEALSVTAWFGILVTMTGVYLTLRATRD